MTTKVLKRVRAMTWDSDPLSDPLRGRTNDMLLTTNARLTAEPAPPAPDLGTLWIGDPGPGRRLHQVTPAEAISAIAERATKGLLSDNEVKAIAAVLKKYGGTLGSTNAAGISSTSGSIDPYSTQASRDVIKGINEANARHHDKRPNTNPLETPTRDSAPKSQVDLIRQINANNRRFHGERA